MRNQKLITCVKALATQKNGYVEAKKHLQTVDSRDMRMLKLYTYLSKAVKESPEVEISREKAYSAVFGKRSTYDKRKMMDLIHRLTSVLEDFVMIYHFKEDKTLKQKKMAEFFRINRNDKYFFKAVEDLKQQGGEKDEAKHYYLRAEVNHDYYFYQSESNHHQHLNTLNEHISDLNTFHAIRYMKASAEKLANSRIHGIAVPPPFLEKIDAFKRFMDEPKSTLLKLLILVVDFYIDPSLDRYLLLKKSLIDELDQLHSEKKALFLFVVNGLAIITFPKGIHKEYFSLYKLGAEKKLLQENGIVSSRMFNNIVLVAHTIKEHDWVEGFIQSHINFLEVPAETKGHIITLAESYCLFGKGRYDEVLSKLEVVKNIDFSYTVRKHVLAFKAEYERDKMDSTELIEEREGNFRRLFNRITREKQINKIYQDKHFNFLNLLKKIANFRFGKYSKAQLIEIFTAYGSQLAEPLWLEEKIQEL